MTEQRNGHDLTSLPLFTGDSTFAPQVRPGRVRGDFRLTGDAGVLTAQGLGLGMVPAEQVPADLLPLATGEVVDWSLVAAFRAQASPGPTRMRAECSWRASRTHAPMLPRRDDARPDDR